MCAQRKRFRILGIKLLHNLSPEHTCGTHLGYLHEEIHTDSPEERQTGSKCIDIHTGIDTCTQVFQTIGKSVSQLNITCRTGFLHVVTGNRYAIELRHILRSVLKYVGDNTHGEFRRINIGVTHHEFLKNVILYGTGHFIKLGTLLQTGIDIECEHRKHSTVHGHRY